MESEGKKRNRTWHFVIPIAVVAVFLFVVLISFSNKFANRFLIVSNDGATFAQGKDNQACLEEALARLPHETTSSLQLDNSSFIVSCLIASKATPNFCTGVPEFSVVHQAAVKDWANQKCKERGLQGLGCQSVYMQVVNYCYMTKGQ